MSRRIEASRTVVTGRVASGRIASGMLLVAIVFGGFALGGWESSFGQDPEYVEIPVDLKKDDARYVQLMRLKQRVASGGAPFASNRDAMNEWYNNFFKSFTQLSELGEVDDKRREVLKDLKVSAAKAPQFRAFVLQKARGFMNAYVTNSVGAKKFNFHPVVRYNSMLLIGQLNEVEAGGSSKFPKPDSQMFGYLVGKFADKDQPDVIRVAALLGVLRHARLDWVNPLSSSAIPVAARKQAAQAALELATTAEPPEGRRAEPHTWMRRRAIETMAALRMLGHSKEHTDAVGALIADRDENLMVRCTAARSLALYQAQGKEKLDLAATANNLAALAVDASKSDLEWISDYRRKKATEETPEGMSIAAFAGIMGQSAAAAREADEAAEMMGVEVETTNAADDQSTGWEGLAGPTNAFGESIGGELDPEVTRAQRRILTKLVCVRKGLDALLAAAKDTPAQDKVATVDSQIESLLKSTVPPVDDSTLDGLAKEFSRAVRELSNKTKTLAARPAPPAVAAPTGS